MTNVIILLAGKSGSGKTTLATELEKRYGLKQLQSYTTRKPRLEGEKCHIFVSEKEFINLNNLVASTIFDGYSYGATSEQIESSDIYIIDLEGIKAFFYNYIGNKKVKVVYLDVPFYIRLFRMVKRGTKLKEAIKSERHKRKVVSAKNKEQCEEGEIYHSHHKKLNDYDSTSRYPRSVLTFATDKQKLYLHSTQKPVALCEYLIRLYSKEGDIVLDNCIGSGTTGVAARNTGRKFIGMELEDKYFEIAERRIANI